MSDRNKAGKTEEKNLIPSTQVGRPADYWDVQDWLLKQLAKVATVPPLRRVALHLDSPEQPRDGTVTVPLPQFMTFEERLRGCPVYLNKVKQSQPSRRSGRRPGNTE